MAIERVAVKGEAAFASNCDKPIKIGAARIWVPKNGTGVSSK